MVVIHLCVNFKIFRTLWWFVPYLRFKVQFYTFFEDTGHTTYSSSNSDVALNLEIVGLYGQDASLTRRPLSMLIIPSKWKYTFEGAFFHPAQIFFKQLMEKHCPYR